MMTFRRSPPVSSSNWSIEGLISFSSVSMASSLSPFSSTTGVIFAIPSGVSTPRMVRTGSRMPGASTAMEMAMSASTVNRLDGDVIWARILARGRACGFPHGVDTRQCAHHVRDHHGEDDPEHPLHGDLPAQERITMVDHRQNRAHDQGITQGAENDRPLGRQLEPGGRGGINGHDAGSLPRAP